MRQYGRLIILVAIGIGALAVLAMPGMDTAAQEPGNSCPILLENAYRGVDTCNSLDRNEACVAGGAITAVGSNPTASHAVGSRFSLDGLEQIQTATQAAFPASWGMLTLVQGAGLPSNAPEMVTMWLLGNATLTDNRTAAQSEAQPAATCYGRVVTDTLNVRNYPSSNASVLEVLSRDEQVIITGRLADSSWWRIDTPYEPAAWVFSGYVVTNCPIYEIPTILRNAPALSAEDWYRDPFQIAVLESGSPLVDCPDAPPPGLLLQPPETGRARLSLNGISFDLEATLYVQANPASGLLFQVLDGALRFTLPDGAAVEVPPGAQYRVPLDSNGIAVAGPSQMEALNMAELGDLPLDLLPHPLAGLPTPFLALPTSADQPASGPLAPDAPATFFFSNRAGIRHEISLTSDAFPVLTISAPDSELVRPYITQGSVSFAYWPTSEMPHLFTIEAGSVQSGTYTLTSQAQDIRLCRPGGNSQSATLSGGEDHAGNIWFGREGELVRLTASGDISTSASSYPDWRFRIAAMFLENATLPPIVFEQLEGHNADQIVWEVPRTGYYWIEVWTVAGGTTTVSAACQ